MCDDIKRMSKEKIIERIQRLLAMGKDTSSPAEAAIAMKRARAMMDTHQITELDLASVERSDIVEQHWQGYISKRTPAWMHGLLIAVAKLNDCVVFRERHETKGFYFTFNGFEADVIVCEFMADYLLDTANRLWEETKKKHAILDARKDKRSWFVGFVKGIKDAVNEILEARKNLQGSTGTALVLCKTQLILNHLGTDEPYKSNRMKPVNVIAWAVGNQCAKDVHLGQFVDDDLPVEKLTAS